jgi:hypothetical protein
VRIGALVLAIALVSALVVFVAGGGQRSAARQGFRSPHTTTSPTHSEARRSRASQALRASGEAASSFSTAPLGPATPSETLVAPTVLPVTASEGSGTGTGTSTGTGPGYSSAGESGGASSAPATEGAPSSCPVPLAVSSRATGPLVYQLAVLCDALLAKLARPTP